MVVDDEWRLVGWSREAEELLRYRPEGALGHPADLTLADSGTGAGSPTRFTVKHVVPDLGIELRHTESAGGG